MHVYLVQGVNGPIILVIDHDGGRALGPAGLCLMSRSEAADCLVNYRDRGFNIHRV